MESIRGSALFDQLLTEHGASQRDFLAPLQIGLDVVGNFGKTLPYLSLVQMFEGSAHALSLPRFGLELALRQGSTLVGPLRHLASSAPTVGHALVAVIRYMRHYSPAIHFRLEHRAGQALLYFDNGLPSSEQTPQIVGKSVMGARLLIGELRGTPLRPRAVTFRHAALGSVGQISNELGYRRTTSFCRAHLRWFDMTPLEHRRQHGDPVIAGYDAIPPAGQHQVSAQVP
ncbi:hypothetical protein BIW19_01735 [Pseudomonas putida]|nr:hypothetical protein BIW19_01735 [Pseudomonas putida]